MTRIAYRDPEDMADRARELTRARGSLNVYRTLANAENVFTGWMVGRRCRAQQHGVAAAAARTRRPAHRISDGLSLRTRPASGRGADGRGRR